MDLCRYFVVLELKESHMATEIKACRTPVAHTNQRSWESFLNSDVLVEVICKKKKKRKTGHGSKINVRIYVCS